MIARMDHAVGQVMDAVDAAGLRERTLIVFTSDNGGVEVLPYSETKVTDNAPLRGAKFQLFEGGIRVPAIASWPGVIPAGSRNSDPVITHDWAATLLAMAGTSSEGLDGQDLTPLLRETGTLSPRVLGWHYPHYMPREDMKPTSAIRYKNWKFILDYESGQIALYDLESDPSESIDLSDSRPDTSLEMQARLTLWLEENHAQLPRVNPDFSSGE